MSQKNSVFIDLRRGQTLKAMVNKLYAEEEKFVFAERKDESTQI